MINIIDKHDLLKKITNTDTVILELGCGSRKRDPKAIGIDALDYPSVDIVGDIYEVLRHFPTGSVNHVSSWHFIEHVNDINALMSELSRILKPKGLVEFVAPHFSNPYYYSDPTHRSYYGLYTFCYLASDSSFRRKVPSYLRVFPFSLERVDLRFKSERPFYFRYALKSLIGNMFNSCIYMKELYEENFCYIFPCYEISYRLRRND